MEDGQPDHGLRLLLHPAEEVQRLNEPLGIVHVSSIGYLTVVEYVPCPPQPRSRTGRWARCWSPQTPGPRPARGAPGCSPPAATPVSAGLTAGSGQRSVGTCLDTTNYSLQIEDQDQPASAVMTLLYC